MLLGSSLRFEVCVLLIALQLDQNHKKNKKKNEQKVVGGQCRFYIFVLNQITPIAEKISVQGSGVIFFLTNPCALCLSIFARYKESITKSTRGWKERLFARNISTPDPGIEVHREVDFARNISMPDPGTEERREVDPGTATVTRMMDYLEISEDSRTDMAPISNNLDDNSTSDTVENASVEMVGNSPLTEVETRAPCAPSSASN